MLGSLRNFECPVTGGQCQDPRCRRARCIQDVEADALEAESEIERAASHAASEAKLRPILEKVARSVLRMANVPHPRLDKLNEAMAHPRIREEAERRLADPHGKHWPRGAPKAKRR